MEELRGGLKTQKLFTIHTCPWKDTQISGTAAGARTLTPKSLKSSSAHSLHMEGIESNPRAALGIKPAYGERQELSPHLISDIHCKAVNVNLERRKTTKEKTDWQRALKGLTEAYREELPQLLARWREFHGSKRRHVNACTAQAVGCKDVAGFQKEFALWLSIQSLDSWLVLFLSWLFVWNTCANWPEFCFSYCSRMIRTQSAVSWVLSTRFPSRNLLTSDFVSSAHSL